MQEAIGNEGYQMKMKLKMNENKMRNSHIDLVTGFVFDSYSFNC